MRYDQQPLLIRLTNRNEARFIIRVIWIGKANSKWVAEDGRGFFEGYAVLT